MRKAAVVSTALLLWVQASAQPRLGAEIVRLRAQVAQRVPADQQPALLARLDRAGAALEAGRSYLGLYLLESPYETAEGMAFAASQTASTLDAFTKAWTAAGPPADGRPNTTGPAVLEALASAAEGRGPATYQASRPYAQDAGVEAGLYYLGESRAVMAYAAFARGGDWPPTGRRPVFRSIAPELGAFDAEMTKQVPKRCSGPTTPATSRRARR